MALLHSEKISSGTPAPDFSLFSVDGKQYSLADFKDKAVLVILFICNHCPYVSAVEDRILNLHREFSPRGVQFIAICSNDYAEYPEDSPAGLEKRWREKNYGFPYLIDESQETARNYKAVCTPDIFVYDRARRLAYHGRIDDHWQDEGKVKRRELAEGLERILQGEPPLSVQHPSMGCSIKWKQP